MARVEIKQDEKSLTHVWVDGSELKKVIEYSLHQSFDTAPVLTVAMDGLGREVDLQNARVDIDVVNQTLENAMKIVRFELLKHGEIYNAFHASILSVLKPKEHYIGDGEFSIEAEEGAYYLAEEILKRIIGEE